MSSKSSRVTTSRSSINGSELPEFGSLEVLPPDEVVDDGDGLQLEEFMSSSEDEENYSHSVVDDNCSNDGVSVDLTIDRLRAGQETSPLFLDSIAASSSNNSTARTLIEHELSVAAEQEEESVEEETENRAEDSQHSQLDIALAKMRKLDRILKSKTALLRRVKKQRINYEAGMSNDLKQLMRVTPDLQQRSQSREEVENTNKYLSLISYDDDEDVEENEPIFCTEPELGNFKQSKHQQNSTYNSGSRASSANEFTTNNQADSEKCNMADDRTHHSSSAPSRKSTSQRAKHGEAGRREKDYIKRNIELAVDSGNIIAMTDDEKNRLKQLLEDIDEESEDLTESNPIAVPPGAGFRPDSEQKSQISDINSKLRALMTPEEFRTICGTPFTAKQSETLFVNTNPSSEDGVKPHYDIAEIRQNRRRLDEIDAQLNYIRQTSDDLSDDDDDYMVISDVERQLLLDQFYRSGTISTTFRSDVTTEYSPSTIRIDEIPTLTEKDLRCLLPPRCVSSNSNHGDWTYVTRATEPNDDMPLKLPQLHQFDSYSIYMPDVDEILARVDNTNLQSNRSQTPTSQSDTGHTVISSQHSTPHNTTLNSTEHDPNSRSLSTSEGHSSSAERNCDHSFTEQLLDSVGELEGFSSDDNSM